MLMEYVQGGELGRHLRNEGTFANETARFYSAQARAVTLRRVGCIVCTSCRLPLCSL